MTKANKKHKVNIKGLAGHYKIEMIYSHEDQAYLANVPELPGCKTHGNTQIEVLKMAHEAIEAYLESLVREDKPIPSPMIDRPFKGEILFRTTPNFHRDLVMRAELEDKSISEFIEEKLKKTI
jgi:predicted RNase H-like HicB family nuclease